MRLWHVILLCVIGALFANRTYLMSLNAAKLQQQMGQLKTIGDNCKLAHPLDCLKFGK